MDDAAASVQLAAEPGCMMFTGARQAALLPLPSCNPLFKMRSYTLHHDFVVVQAATTTPYLADQIPVQVHGARRGKTLAPINDLHKRYGHGPCRCGVISMPSGKYDPLWHEDGMFPEPREHTWVESCYCKIPEHNRFSRSSLLSSSCTLDTIFQSDDAGGGNPTRAVTYDCLQLRQHRLEVITGAAAAIVVLSVAPKSRDWVFFVGRGCRGRPPGPFACRFITIIQQKDVRPQDAARLFVWRLHVCCTPALMDVLNCALHPDAGLVAPDVVSTVLLALVFHRLAHADAHGIVRRTLDRLACDSEALQDLPSLLWLCLAATTLPTTCVSGLVLATVKRTLARAVPVVHATPLCTLLLAWVLHVGRPCLLMDADTGRRVTQAAAALECPDGSGGFCKSPTATAIAVLAQVCTCAETTVHTLLSSSWEETDLSWGAVLVQSVVSSWSCSRLPLPKKKDDNSVCSVLVHAIAAGGMVLFSHV